MFPPYPPESSHGCDASHPEARVFHALQVQLPDTYHVFYSVQWIAKGGGPVRDGEADFVIAHPNKGFLVMEVKGGQIEYDGESQTWRRRSWGSPQPVRDPFLQAKTSKHQLLERLRDLTSASIPAVGHCACLPDVTHFRGILPPHVVPEILITREQLQDIRTRVDSLFTYWAGSSAASRESAWFHHLRKLLAPAVKFEISLASDIHSAEKQTIELTHRQLRTLHVLAASRRLFVHGCAGSGKTVLAMARAKQLSEQGFFVLFVCSGRFLAEHIRRNLLPDDNIVVVSREERLDHVPTSGEEFTDLWERFDAVIVDEAQDFDDEELSSISLCLRDSTHGVFWAFLDDNQRLNPSRVRSVKDEHFYPLLDNLRNTQQIHKCASRFYLGEVVPGALGAPGRPVEGFPIDGMSLTEAIRKVLHRLLYDERLTPADVGILTARRDSELFRTRAVGPYSLTQDPWNPNDVLCLSIDQFKGLERHVIVLVEIDELASDQRDAQLYVGMSRATYHLIILARAGTLKGVEGVALGMHLGGD